MKTRQPRRINNHGFTLIELMIVVVIIGILASMALPRFMMAATKAKQSEAKGLLKQIYTMQEAYFGLSDSYCLNGAIASSAAPIAYARIHVEVMLPARYLYTMASTGNIDDDATIDTWTIDQTGTLINTIDDARM
jgi:type IV pilus assembly protein PilE